MANYGKMRAEEKMQMGKKQRGTRKPPERKVNRKARDQGMKHKKKHTSVKLPTITRV